MCAYWDIPSMVHGTRLYHNTPNMNHTLLKTHVRHFEAKGEYMIGNISLTRFPEMYVTLEGTPFADCPALLVVIALLVVAACVALPLYVYRRKIYYKCVMVVYRRRKDKLARELKKRMKIHKDDPRYALESERERQGGSDMVTCLICMDPLLDATTTDLVIILDACGHRFHFKCILKWLDMSDGCPICRKTVDVNDRGALRLVYSDCRPSETDDATQVQVDIYTAEREPLTGETSNTQNEANTHRKACTETEALDFEREVPDESEAMETQPLNTDVQDTCVTPAATVKSAFRSKKDDEITVEICNETNHGVGKSKSHGKKGKTKKASGLNVTMV